MSRLRRPKGIRSRGIRGQALVEFALVIPIFLLVMIALFDLGRAVFAYNTLTNAAREGARMAIVNQYEPTIRSRAKSQTAIVELDDPSVTVEFRQVNADGTPDMSDEGKVGCPAVGCLAIVSFEATYYPITPIISNILFGSGVTFSAKSVLSVEYHCPTLTITAAQCPKQP
jgi:hypothetical protein